MSIDQTVRYPSRRLFLRGVGVALALPWMESLPVPGRAAAAGMANTPPLRLGIVFFSNGVEPEHWWAKGNGAAMPVGPGLSPMLPHREDMLFIQGLFNETAQASTSPHLGRMNVLSGAPVSLDPKEIRVGTSMDQILDHMTLMLDLIVLAFQMDKTRVATLMLNNDLSQMNFKFLEGVQGALHLDLTHNGRAADKEEMYLRTNQFHIAQFAYLTQRMKEIPGGRGDAPRQLDSHADVEPLRRRSAHGRPPAVPAHRQGRGHPETGAGARLFPEGRRTPQGVQPAPVAHGQDGGDARPVR
jgi:hypothetical protein